jgi:hypothetical protein
LKNCQRLGFAAEQSGSSLETLGGVLFRMQRRIANAATEGGPAVRALRELGLEAEAIKELSPDQQFKLIADKLADLKDETFASQLAFEIFGGEAQSLIPLLRSGSQGIEEMQKQAKDLGREISKEAATAAAEFSDKLNELKSSLTPLLTELGTTAMPILQDLADATIPIIKAFGKWIGDNKNLTSTLFKVGLGATAAGLAIAKIGLAIYGTGIATKTLISSVLSYVKSTSASTAATTANTAAMQANTAAKVQNAAASGTATTAAAGQAKAFLTLSLRLAGAVAAGVSLGVWLSKFMPSMRAYAAETEKAAKLNEALANSLQRVSQQRVQEAVSAEDPAQRVKDIEAAIKAQEKEVGGVTASIKGQEQVLKSVAPSYLSLWQAGRKVYQEERQNLEDLQKRREAANGTLTELQAQLGQAKRDLAASVQPQIDDEKTIEEIQREQIEAIKKQIVQQNESQKLRELAVAELQAEGLIAQEVAETESEILKKFKDQIKEQERLNSIRDEAIRQLKNEGVLKEEAKESDAEIVANMRDQILEQQRMNKLREQATEELRQQGLLEAEVNRETSKGVTERLAELKARLKGTQQIQQAQQAAAMQAQPVAAGNAAVGIERELRAEMSNQTAVLRDIEQNTRNLSLTFG